MDPILLSAISLVISVLCGALLGLTKYTADTKDKEVDRRFASTDNRLDKLDSAVNQHSVEIQRTQGRIDVTEEGRTHIMAALAEIKSSLTEMSTALREIRSDMDKRGK